MCLVQTNRTMKRNKGFITLKIKKGRWLYLLGNASIIQYGEKIFGLTTAHCFLSETNLINLDKVYIEYYSRGKLNCIKIGKVFIHPEWKSKGSVFRDLAVFGIPENLPKPENVYFIGNSFHTLQDTVILAKTGFLKKNYCVRLKNSDYILSDTNMIGWRCKMPAGVSGAPIFLESNGKLYQIGIVSARIRRYKTITWGILLDENNLNFIINKIGVI